MIARTLAALTALTALLLLAAPARAQCVATRPDALGPFYKANAPERASTGQGLVVSGSVRSLRGVYAASGRADRMVVGQSERRL